MIDLILSALIETRICEPTNVRSPQVLAAFQRIHHCPSTGLPTGNCPGWAKDHVIPLACGGCDSVSNLQWLPNEIKSAAFPAKDRWERNVYAQTPNAACRPRIFPR